MNTVKKFLMLIASLLLCACAKLDVGVEVLNSDKLRIRNEMPIILALDNTTITRDILSFEAIHRKYYDKQISLLNKKYQNAKKEGMEKESILYEANAKDLNDGFVNTIGPYYDRKEGEWKERVRTLKTQYKIYDQNTDKEKEKRLRTALIIGIDQYDNFKSDIVDYRLHDLNESINEDLFTRGEQEIVNPRQTLFKSGGLEHSPALYNVVNAPKKDWAKYFDRSYGAGYFGNVDIAIKALDSPGNFTVKGLSFNPADVATMASKVTTQSVVLAAQIAGVPVNISGTPSGDGAQLANVSTRISAAVASSEELKVSLNNQQLALISLAQAILAEQNNITNINKQEEALNAIKASYESHKVNMSIPTKATGDEL